jgi:uncharacterized membrane protein
MNEARQRFLHMGAVGTLLALIALGIAWEWALAPLRPGGSWLVLKIVPLLLPLRGIWKRDLYTMQWSSMLILLYLAEGVVRGLSDRGLSSTLGWIETALTLLFFFCVVSFIRPYKKAAKALAKKALQKAAE